MKVQKQKLNIKAIKNILQKQFQIKKYILFTEYGTPWKALFK